MVPRIRWARPSVRPSLSLSRDRAPPESRASLRLRYIAQSGSAPRSFIGSIASAFDPTARFTRKSSHALRQIRQIARDHQIPLRARLSATPSQFLPAARPQESRQPPPAVPIPRAAAASPTIAHSPTTDSTIAAARTISATPPNSSSALSRPMRELSPPAKINPSTVRLLVTQPPLRFRHPSPSVLLCSTVSKVGPALTCPAADRPKSTPVRYGSAQHSIRKTEPASIDAACRSSAREIGILVARSFQDNKEP